ncbi:MAG: hypothetical protein RL153_265 [Verrucomicrobiota bacterium]|jgi:hypothetical protein
MLAGVARAGWECGAPWLVIISCGLAQERRKAQGRFKPQAGALHPRAPRTQNSVASATRATASMESLQRCHVCHPAVPEDLYRLPARLDRVPCLPTRRQPSDFDQPSRWDADEPTPPCDKPPASASRSNSLQAKAHNATHVALQADLVRGNVCPDAIARRFRVLVRHEGQRPPATCPAIQPLAALPSRSPLSRLPGAFDGWVLAPIGCTRGPLVASARQRPGLAWGCSVGTPNPRTAGVG